MNIPLNSNTLAAWLAADLAGTLTNDEQVQLMQYLINDGSIWAMGPTYAEFAEFLLQMGYCLLPESESARLGWTPAPRCNLGMDTVQYPDPCDTDPFCEET